MTIAIETLLKYANLQMAAEASGLRAGMTGAALAAAIVEGNSRTSKFPDSIATTFSSEWAVVEQGEMVLSFCSTEFIDDAARDNQATNSMEISKFVRGKFGRAFGQIDDMQQWLHTCAAQ